MATALGIALCFCLVLGIVNCDGDVHSESDLRKAIFANYDKLVRPVRNAHDAVPVRTILYPVGIKDVDVKDHIVKIDTWFYMRWVDQFLSWDPSDYGGLQALRVHADEIWRPDLAVYYGTPDTHLMPTVHTNVVLYYNGTALWIPPFSVKSRCQESLEQPAAADGNFHCTILVGSWTYDVTLLDVQEHVTDALQSAKESFHDSDHEWTLESMNAHHELKLYDCCTEEYPVVKHELVLKRRHSDHAHQDSDHAHHDAHHAHHDAHHGHQDGENAHQDGNHVHQDTHHVHHDAHHAHQDGNHTHQDGDHAHQDTHHGHQDSENEHH